LKTRSSVSQSPPCPHCPRRHMRASVHAPAATPLATARKASRPGSPAPPCSLRRDVGHDRRTHVPMPVVKAPVEEGELTRLREGWIALRSCDSARRPSSRARKR
jgi:hypothetical protein